MQRLTVFDVRNSRLPGVLGVCTSDTPTLCSYINEAQQRLILAGGNEGWWGGWSKMVFNVLPCTGSCTDPYITAPREVARLEDINICETPIRIQNEFYEFMEFGIGLQKASQSCNCRTGSGTQAFDRGQYPVAVDLVAGNKIRVYATNASDVAQGKRLFVQGKDTNDAPVYSLDNGVTVTGEFIALATPFADSLYNYNSIARLQKDVMMGPISVYQVDAAGTEILMSTLAPGETNPAFRRYLLKGLPCQCTGCGATAGQTQVTAMCKLDYIPVASDTDALTVQNIPALKEELLSVRYGEMDTTESVALTDKHHRNAIKLLNGELEHFLGKQNPAMIFRPFGTPCRQTRLQII